ncbi:MFS transporter [Sphingomonas sp. SUN039]|uniref:MFS transporter n=1 Tax=Sphingomonas sp. SUN039 TaxID=2937787 RepID=UPI00216427C5|nr:MFS transporter [Sphingomonas sp. SUN039]UVO54376.1 MFS transporter [Sphingomonas sp. SUN039]
MADGDTIYAKVRLHVVAPLAVLIVLSSIDRVNVSFAALHMNDDIGLGPKAYGLGASIFFVGYLLCQLPSMAVLRRIGPRRWIGASVACWGLVAAAMAFIQTPMQFYTLRFLLGVFESGFAPGVVWYVSQWLPPAYRSRSIGLTLLAIPASVIVGGPLSGALMKVSLAGIEGWRVMFFIEGAATMLGGIAAWFWFVDRPAQARWLSDDERGWVAGAQPAASAQTAGETSYLAHLANPLLWLCAVLWFVLVGGANAIIFWLPTAIKAAGTTDTLVVGVLSALPWIAIGTGMIVGARRSDLSGNRTGYVALAAGIAATGFVAAAVAGPNAAGLALLVAGCFGLGAAQGIYWAIPTAFNFGRDPRAIATINLIGNLNGIVVPAAIGWVVATTGSMVQPMVMLALALVTGTIIAVVLGRRRAIVDDPTKLL